MHPKTRKGAVRKYEVSAVGWLDLLGYGSMLAPVGFDPSTEEAINAVNRLSEFHDFVAPKSNRYLRMLAMNDGIITYRDLSPRTNSVSFDFLTRNYILFKEANLFDINNGYFGARMILSPGFRVRSQKRSNLTSKGNIILRKLKNKEITPEQAVYESLDSTPTFGVVPELQANFAFTKSYLADKLGSKGGFGGNNMYVDLSFFCNMNPPEWITYDEIIDFEQLGIKTKFIRVLNLDIETARRNRFFGILDAFDIGLNIAQDEKIVERLLKSTFSNNLRKKN